MNLDMQSSEYHKGKSLTRFTQQRMMSQITSQGASDFSPSGFAWVLDIRYPALITAERKTTADRGVHLTVPVMLC